jgi:hypothetical protein
MTPASLALIKKNAQEVEFQTLDKIGDLRPIGTNRTYRPNQVQGTLAHIGSFGFANRISDGQNVPLDEFVRLNRKTFTATDRMRAKGFSTTYQGKKIDPFQIMKRASPELMGSMVQTRNALVSAFHSTGFTANTTAPDSVSEAFYSATHAGGPAGGTTYSNLGTPQAPSTAALIEAQTNISVQRTSRNMVIPAPTSLTVICPYALEVVFAQLIESATVADTADRAENKVIRSRYSYKVDPFATSSTQWYVKGEGDHLDRGVYWCQFTDLDVVETGVDMAASSAILILETYDIGWVSGRGWYGNAGA